MHSLASLDRGLHKRGRRPFSSRGHDADTVLLITTGFDSVRFEALQADSRLGPLGPRRVDPWGRERLE